MSKWWSRDPIQTLRVQCAGPQPPQSAAAAPSTMHVALPLHGRTQGSLGVERLEAGRPGRDGTPAWPNDAKVWTRALSNALEGESDRKCLEDGADSTWL